MKMRTRTKRRLLLLAGAAGLVVVSGFLFFVVRDWRRDATSNAMRAEGLAAAERGEWRKAIEDTGSYIKRRGPEGERDAEVVLAYARSRLALEEPDGTHIVQAIAWFQRYVDLKPDDRAVKKQLLDLRIRAAMFPEARDLATQLRPADLAAATAADIPVLREEAKALFGSKTAGERLDRVLGRLLELDPLDIDGHIVRLEMLAARGDRSQGRAHGEALLKAHPDDPRAFLVAALARIQLATADDSAIASELLLGATGLDPAASRVKPVRWTDVDHVRRLMEALDAVGMFRHTIVVLQDALQTYDDIDLKRSLVRRLWQDGRVDEVRPLVQGLSRDDRKADSELLGFQALMALQSGDTAGAMATAEKLKAREADIRAAAFAALLENAPREGGKDTREATEALETAIRDNGNEPLLHFTLGELLAQLGRAEEARAAWTRATTASDPLRGIVARGWSLPHLRVAETLLVEGRAVEAARAATRALALDPTKLGTNVVFFEAQSARLLVNSEEGPAALVLLDRLEQADKSLDGVDAALAKPFRERMIPPRIVFLARAGRTDEARSVAERALSGERAIDAGVLRRIAAISASEGLGIEQAAMDRARQQFGDTAEVLYARAIEMAVQGKQDEGIRALRDAAEQNATDLSYQIALARYLEGRSDADSIKQWSGIVERFGTDVFALRSVLSSPTAARDRALIESAIEKYRAATGRLAGDDVVVRVARARTTLVNQPTKQELDRAIAALGEVVQANPTLIEPRVVLAAAHSMSDPTRGIEPDYGRAITQINAALASDPRSSDLLLELGRLEQLRGDVVRAREQLVKVAQDTQAGIEPRWRAAELLIAQGDTAPVALRTLEELSTKLGENTPVRMLGLLGEAYRIERQDAKAAETFARLEKAATDPDSLYLVARFLASRGEEARAEAVLGRIETGDLPAWVGPLARARLWSDRGDTQRAIAAYEQAVKAGPKAPEVWRAYADHFARRGELDQAVSTADRGLAEIGQDPPLAVIREQARIMLSEEADADLGPMIQALSGQAEHAGTLALLRSIQRARVQGSLNPPEQLNALLQQSPGSVPLMMYVARKLAPLDPEQAIGVALRATNAAAMDPAPARLLTELHMGLRRWPEMLQAAQQWRQRERSLSPEPDLAMAEAHANMNQPQRGIDLLRSHVPAAMTTPREAVSLGVLTTNARLLVLVGREKEALDQLRPLLQKEAVGRVFVGMNLASRLIPDFAVAKRWLDEIATMVPADDAEEQLQLVNAWITLGARFPDRGTALAAEGDAILKRLQADPKLATAGVHEAVGIMRHRENKLPEAEASYRKALELDATRAVSLNNLADILRQRGEFEQALALSRRAVELRGRDPSFLETLGSIYVAMADARQAAGDSAEARKLHLSAAAAFRQVCLIIPADHAPLTRYAFSSDRGGDDKAAEWAYERLLAMRSYPAAYVPSTKNNLAIVLMRLNRGPQDLSRALTLASEAARAEQNPAFVDTLGWAQALGGQAESAVRTFRDLLPTITPESDAGGVLSYSARLGLARALSSGNPEARAEGKRLLAEIEKLPVPAGLEGKLSATQALLSN